MTTTAPTAPAGTPGTTGGSASTTPQTAPRPRASDTPSGAAIVVAVDGSEANRAAVDWAADHAAATGRPLLLVTVGEEAVFPVPYPVIVREEALETILDAAAARVATRHPEVEINRRHIVGPPLQRLIDISADHRCLVVGKRGLGAFGRVLVGSTSIAVAGRAAVPVVIVPEDWEQAVVDDGPVVVGIDPADPSERLLRSAFEEAQRNLVGLSIVHAVLIHPVLAGEPGLSDRIYSEWSAKASLSIEALLAPLRAEFPDVDVDLRIERGHPGAQLLERTHGASLLVLGRHKENRVAGFAFSSVTRGVLHYADAPVMVVPTS